MHPMRTVSLTWSEGQRCPSQNATSPATTANLGQMADTMRFKIEPRLLDHFGIAMYNSVPKAIAELAANAYDADATKVKITKADDRISIKDDGIGMTESDVRNRFLRLGRDRRQMPDGETSGSGRPVIGNKGIGKLAGFGIAQTMSVETVCEGVRTSLTIDRDELESSEDLADYEIAPVVVKTRSKKHGTTVTLDRILDEINMVDDDKLRAYLARHLPARNGFSIWVNGIECKAKDIPGEKFRFNDKIAGFGEVSGYYVVATDKRSLDPGFTIRVRDRVVREASLFGLNQQTHGYFNLVRIVGEIEPDFVDPVKGKKSRRETFVINTSRDGFNPDAPEIQALEDYAKKKLEKIAKGLADQRAKDRKKAALKRNQGFEERLKALGPEIYVKLDRTIEDLIAKLAKNEDDETVDQIVDFIIRYYESDSMRILLSTIGEADDAEVERLSNLLAHYGAARIAEVAGMLDTQLQIIETLRTKVASGALEADIHKVIAENIWLLRDDLTFWFSNKQFATQLSKGLARSVKTKGKQRPDLVCFDNRKAGAKAGAAPKRLVVVEFKRPGVEVSQSELMQVMTYKSVFQKSLTGFDTADIDVVVLGDRFDPTFDRSALSKQYQILSYEELLANARDRYRDLFDKLAPNAL